MSLLRIDTELKRVWIFNKRIHHGAVGFISAALGIALMKHDIKDFPWLRDND